MDADTAETIGGVVRFLCRAAQLVWEPVDAEGGGSPQQVLALGIDLAADEAHDLLADALQIGGPVPVGDEPASLHARLSSCCEASPPQEAGSSYMSSGPCGRPGLEGEHRCRRLIVARSASCWPTATH